MIKTTVVIPNYNGEKYIEQCLDSLLACENKINIIVVDNGSSDKSVEIIKSKYSSVDLVELNENTGFCHAVNLGISLSKTPYVFLFNNDATVNKDTIKKLEADLDSDDKLFSAQAMMLSMSDPTLVDSAGDEFCALGWAFATGKDKNAQNYKGKRYVFSACGGAALYRRDAFEKIGDFDENHFAYLEDVDIGYRARINGYKNMVDKDAIVLHAGSKTSGSRHNDFKVKLSARNSIYLIYKNMPALMLILNLPFVIIGIIIKSLFFARKNLFASYAKGIAEGLKLCFSTKGQENKVRFKKENLSTYIAIEIILIVNVFRRFLG